MAWLRRILWVTTGAYWVLIFTLTHLPQHHLHGAIVLNDKHLHFLAFGGLAFLLGLTLLLAMPRRRWVPLFVLAVAMAYGAFDERTQMFFNRTCELGDWLADAAGAATAAGFLALIQWKMLRITSPRPAPEMVRESAGLGVASEA